jgi:hypothetical protein
MAFMVKNPGLMPGFDTLKSGDIKKRRQEIEEIITGCWRSCIEAGDGMGVAPLPHKRDVPVDERYTLPGDPGNRPFVADAIIANPPSFGHIHIAEKLGIPLHMMFTLVFSLHISLIWPKLTAKQDALVTHQSVPPPAGRYRRHKRRHGHHKLRLVRPRRDDDLAGARGCDQPV